MDSENDSRVNNDNDNDRFERDHLPSLVKMQMQSPILLVVPPASLNNDNTVEHQVLNEGEISSSDIVVVSTTTQTAIPRAPCTSDHRATPHRNRRCNTAPWDERMNWSKKKTRRRSLRSFDHSNSNSSTSSDSSNSTQLLLPQPPRPANGGPIRPTAATMVRNSSIGSSTSSSSLSLSDYSAGDGVDHQQQSDQNDPQRPMERHDDNPLFFSPRRRLNSLVLQGNNNNNRTAAATVAASSTTSAVPMAVVSIPTISDTSIENGVVHGSSDVHVDDSHRQSEIWWIFRVWLFGNGSNMTTTMMIAPQQQRINTNQRRNLLLLFLIATYTTFGIASPNVQQEVATLLTKNSNVIVVDDTVIVQDGESISSSTTILQDIPLVAAEDHSPTSAIDTSVTVSGSDVSTSSSSLLRGHNVETSQRRASTPVVNNHLSFVRGAVNANGNPKRPLLVYRRREMNDFYHQPALLQEDSTTMTSWYLNCFVLLLIAAYYIVRERTKLLSSCTTTTSTSGVTIHMTHHLL